MDIVSKLEKIQALIDRTSSEGERQAAEYAKQRLFEKIPEKPLEYRIVSASRWEKKLFVTLCKKHGLSPYRYFKQKHTTTMLRVTQSVLNNVLWPEYQKYTSILRQMMDEIATDLIHQIYAGDKEEEVIAGELSSQVREI